MAKKFIALEETSQAIKTTVEGIQTDVDTVGTAVNEIKEDVGDGAGTDLVTRVANLETKIDALASGGGGGLKRIVPCSSHRSGGFKGATSSVNVSFDETITENSVVELHMYDKIDEATERVRVVHIPVGKSVSVTFKGTQKYNTTSYDVSFPATVTPSTTGVKFAVSGGNSNTKYVSTIYFYVFAYVF